MASKSKGGTTLDFASIGGVLVGVGGILAGLLIEGGKMSDIGQTTAGMIVFGGTLGAVMITSPQSALIEAAKSLMSVFLFKNQKLDGVLDEIMEYASQARKQGIVSLEQQANAAADPFLKKALNLAVDGIDPHQIRDIMELEIELSEQREEAAAKVFEAAGGYSPTIGIIGAVLGLIQVMKHLADIDGVGRGIAGAFIATVYGVAAANLLFLPAAAKLRSRMKASMKAKEVMLEGVLAIAQGLNPKLIRSKLEAFLDGKAPAAKAAKGTAGAAQPVAAEG